MILRLIAFTTLALALAGCEQGNSASGPTVKPPVSVTVAEVIKQNIADRRERVGQLQAIEAVELRARIEGFLEQRRFDEGSDVKKGDLLFVIERAPYEAEVARAQAELASDKAGLQKAKLDLARSRELRIKGTVSQAILDESIALERQGSANVLARQAELRQAQINLDYIPRSTRHSPVALVAPSTASAIWSNLTAARWPVSSCWIPFMSTGRWVSRYS
jgi:membrane fusion protein (multidrug efflux system)